MLVLGAGPGGYSAAFRSADLGMTTVLVERYPTLGGVCLNVGCIPSKALLHTAAVMDEVKAMAAHGIAFSEPQIDLAKLRGHKEKVVGKLTGGLAGMAKARKVSVLQGVGRFLDPYHLEVAVNNGGGRQVVKFDKAIIAAGSQAIKLPFIPDDPRVVDSTGALELRQIPKSMLVIGGGIIGLEMATVYSTLGTRIDVVEMLDGLMTGADRDLVKVWEKKNAGRFDKVMLKTKTVSAEATPDGIKVGFEGEKAPAEPQLYDMVMVAVGRSPNGKKDRRREGGRRGERPRLRRSRQANAHQHAAHLRHRRHRRPTDAGAQGRARGTCRGGDRGRQEQRVRGAPDPFSRLHRPGGRVGGRHRRAVQGARHQVRQGRVSVGRIWSRDRQRARRGIHQAAVR